MSLPPPPQSSPGSPPELVDDVMRDIFLLIPADDPKSLVRAASVCTRWQSILSDVVFTREYRTLHGTPPMLGFLHNTSHTRREERNKQYFVSTTSFRPPACHERRRLRALDSRHGLVLFHTSKRGEDFVIWDLVTKDWWRIKASDECSDIISHDQNDEGIQWNAAVLCAKDQCDHVYCHGGPFRVALVGSDEEQGITFASVYSSETHKWSDMISIEEPNAIMKSGHIAVVGDKVYFQCQDDEIIAEYNIGEQIISVFDQPVEDEDNHLPYAPLVGVEDGMLLFAYVLEPRLYLWSMEAGPNRAENWARRSVIELDLLLPPPALLDVSVVGFAEGVGVIFLNTKAGLYTIELNSGQSKKVHRKTSGEKVMPYMSFYTRGTI
ncbi:hypothetical protein ACQ4PT_053458 [Festuca glaucescens]